MEKKNIFRGNNLISICLSNASELREAPALFKLESAGQMSNTISTSL